MENEITKEALALKETGESASYSGELMLEGKSVKLSVGLKTERDESDVESSLELANTAWDWYKNQEPEIKKSVAKMLENENSSPEEIISQIWLKEFSTYPDETINMFFDDNNLLGGHSIMALAKKNEGGDFEIKNVEMFG